jgi:hypothetical protein
MSKKTIGIHPLTEYLSLAQVAESPITEIPEEFSCTKKQRVTIHIPVDLIERVKNAVYWEPGFTLAGFAELALLTAIEQLEKERGSAYPARKQQLKGGRPLK